jgi:hypothetical protein
MKVGDLVRRPWYSDGVRIAPETGVGLIVFIEGRSAKIKWLEKNYGTFWTNITSLELVSGV